MPVFTIALMGFLAFTAGPVPAVEATGTATAVASTTLAIASPGSFTPAPDEESLTVTLTSYNAVPEQTDGNPLVTASGALSNPDVVAARSVDLAGSLPYGTVIELSRDTSDTGRCRFDSVKHLIGYRVVADSMHERKRKQVDILLDPTDTVTVEGKSINPAIALGYCSGVSIRVVGKIAIKDIPKTQEELRTMIEGTKLALAR